MRQSPIAPMSLPAVLTLLLAPLVGSGCAAAPWTCTSDTCVTVATADLPDGVRGNWQGKDGTTLKILAIYLGDLEDVEIFPRAATMHWRPRPPLGGDAHVTSFDGRTAIAEQRLGAAEEAPRRFFRLRVEDDSLDVAELSLDALMAASDRRDVQLVTTEHGEAVAYEDIQAMAATIQQLLADPEAWGSEVTYTRSSS
jgi:hypothetical protein